MHINIHMYVVIHLYLKPKQWSILKIIMKKFAQLIHHTRFVQTNYSGLCLYAINLCKYCALHTYIHS